MASLYKRNNSPFWWIKYRDAKGVHRESTGFRVGVGPDTRAARELEAKRSLAECSAPKYEREAGWNFWVEKTLHEKYDGRSRERYLTAWRSLKMFLDEKQILTPAQITYDLCEQYVPWRLIPDTPNGKYRCSRNTANLEFKLLRWLLKKAVQKGFCPANPAREVELKRAEKKLFLEFEAEHEQLIWTGIANEDEPARTALRRSFLVSRYHGVRLNETNVNPMLDVKLTTDTDGTVTGTILFRQKRARKRIKPLHPDLIPLFQKLQRAGANFTYPPWPHGWGNRWTKFFRRIGLQSDDPNQRYCFHSLRVTVQNLLRRAGIPKELREMYLTHERIHEEDSNRIYDRFKDAELRKCHAPLSRRWICDGVEHY